MNFQTKYSEILNIVKEDIEAINKEITSLIQIEEPLKSKLIEFLQAPSKRIRPLVTILYLRACNINVTQRHYKLLTAVELMHNASLIHDDIIDESKTRRNIKTLNFEFDNKLAVISGDYILSKALFYLSEIKSPETIDIFAQTLSQMCEGETFQYFNKFEIPTLENYLKKTEQKTAKLFQSALESAILISKKELFHNASEFGKNFGTAFQIRDDLINAKTLQTDIIDGIYTAPVIFAGNTQNIQSGIEKTYCLLDKYIEKAKQSLSTENNKYKHALEELLELLRYE